MPDGRAILGVRFRFTSPLPVSFPFPFIRLTDRWGPVEAATWVEMPAFGTPVPCRIGIRGVNVNKTNGSAYHLQV